MSAHSTRRWSGSRNTLTAADMDSRTTDSYFRGMAAYSLVVSNPPQNGLDVETAARHLGLEPDEVRGKARYSVPEIWFANHQPELAADTAAALRAAGARVTLAEGDELAGTPPRHKVKSFSFGASGLVAHCADGNYSIAYDLPVVLVYCRPRETAVDLSSPRTRRSSGFVSVTERIFETRTSGGSVLERASGDAGSVPFLDIYLLQNGHTWLRVIQNAVDYSGLGHVQPRAASNLEALVERCEDLFGTQRVDRRLVGMRLRRADGGRRAAAAEHRKGYSFASPGLTSLLESISPGLEGISQSELSTRLAFLTRRETV